MSIPALVLLGATAWEGAFVAGLTHPASRVDVVRRCVDTADLIAASVAGLAGVAIVGADTPRLDSDVLARVIDSGMKVIGIASRDDEAAIQRLESWGVHEVVPLDQGALGTSVSATIAAVHRLASVRGGVAVPAGTPAASRGAETSPSVPVFAVWGPAGSPGRTSVAVGLADEFSRVGHRTVLIDADTWAPSVSLVLGLADDGVGLASACRRALSGALDERSFGGILREINHEFRVLCGIGRSGRWTEVRRSAMATVITRARAMADVVVVDCGFSLESDEEFVFDTAAPRRNAATFVSLEQATDIVVVGNADPVGLVRLVNGLSQLDELELTATRHVVANRVRESMLGRRPHESVADVLYRHAGVDAVWCIPDDPRAYDAALREGCTLAENSDGSPARLAIKALASSLMSSAQAERVPA